MNFNFNVSIFMPCVTCRHNNYNNTRALAQGCIAFGCGTDLIKQPNYVCTSVSALYNYNYRESACSVCSYSTIRSNRIYNFLALAAGVCRCL